MVSKSKLYIYISFNIHFYLRLYDNDAKFFNEDLVKNRLSLCRSSAKNYIYIYIYTYIVKCSALFLLRGLTWVQLCCPMLWATAAHEVIVGSGTIDRTINVHETGSVMRSNVSWIDLQSIKVNSLVT